MKRRTLVPGSDVKREGVEYMGFKKLAAAAASAALIVTPSLATAANAGNAPTEVAPASETVEGEQIYGASVLLQLGIVLVVAAVLYFGVKQLGGGKDDDPASP